MGDFIKGEMKQTVFEWECETKLHIVVVKALSSYYGEEYYYYEFVDEDGRHAGSYNELSRRLTVPNKIRDLDLLEPWFDSILPEYSIIDIGNAYRFYNGAALVAVFYITTDLGVDNSYLKVTYHGAQQYITYWKSYTRYERYY